jgi:hypothetical protein
MHLMAGWRSTANLDRIRLDRVHVQTVHQIKGYLNGSLISICRIDINCFLCHHEKSVQKLILRRVTPYALNQIFKLVHIRMWLDKRGRGFNVYRKLSYLGLNLQGSLLSEGPLLSTELGSTIILESCSLLSGTLHLIFPTR